MASWNPEDAQEAAKYLRLPDTDMLTIRSAPFDGKKAVWVPSKEHGYVKGTVQDKKASKDGCKVRVFY